MNQHCVYCGNLKTHLHGGRRRKCPTCGKTFVTDPQQTGRKPIGDRPMTGHERLQNT